ncbi:hypothetical protein F5148DRAFT_1154719 [Russula earlei]|uniref:Uncharacterized protein n=1 Tax=Russula earlei TaxID=71964 RepID=A0ACC0TRC1_9AGAM|nr:hypothetical protein F5148DRAFT_1154719 [Russula earlei]
MRNLEKSSKNIKKAFEDQQARATLFDEVEKPEFINLMNFTHCTGPLNIQNMMGSSKQKLEGKVCLSIDAWTSSNQREYGGGSLGNTGAIWSHQKNYCPHNGQCRQQQHPNDVA